MFSSNLALTFLLKSIARRPDFAMLKDNWRLQCQVMFDIFTTVITSYLNYRRRSSMTDTARRPGSEIRRKQILDAAADVFGSKNYHWATTKEIAKEAGVFMPNGPLSLELSVNSSARSVPRVERSSVLKPPMIVSRASFSKR